MTNSKILLFGAALVLSTPAFAQNYNRGTDPLAAGAAVGTYQDSGTTLLPRFSAEAPVVAHRSSHRIDARSWTDGAR